MSDSLPPYWTLAHQDPLSMGFFRQECCSGLPCPPPGDLPNQGIKPTSLMSPALAGRFFTTSATWEPSDSVEESIASILKASEEFPLYHAGSDCVTCSSLSTLLVQGMLSSGLSWKKLEPTLNERLESVFTQTIPLVVNYNICCCCSVATSFPTLCDSMSCSTPGFPALRYQFTSLLTFIEFILHPVQLYCWHTAVNCSMLPPLHPQRVDLMFILPSTVICIGHSLDQLNLCLFLDLILYKVQILRDKLRWRFEKCIHGYVSLV